MSVRIRARNFQSLKDAEVTIDGFAVVTGPNNSGKTALMRAIHGVFTNAAPGALIRHGEAYLSVEMEFGDGTHILWEKGWEKPGQKGKVVNRYKVNGVEINSVGKGPPPEVEALGVRQIMASTDRVWPQIAEQFDGVLFLVNRPPSAVAEALSDVDRVGKLSNALKLSDKDRRAASEELGIRRKDVKQLRDDLKFFEGLDSVSKLVSALDPRDIADLISEIQGVERLRATHKDAKQGARVFVGFEEAAGKISGLSAEIQEARALETGLKTARELRSRRAGLKTVFDSLVGFSPAVVPDTARAIKLSEATRRCVGFQTQRSGALQVLAAYKDLKLPTLPDGSTVNAVRDSLAEARALSVKLSKAREAAQRISAEETTLLASLGTAVDEVRTLLGDRGICPTCHTIHSGPHAEAR